MANYDLIAFDLDGTAFATPYKAEVSTRLRQAFERAHGEGVVITVASGRPNWMIGEQLTHAEWLDWRILANGSRVIPSRGSDEGLSRPIPRTEAMELLERLAELGGALNLHTGHASYVERRKAEYFAAEQRRAARKGLLPEDIDDASGEPRQLNPIDAAARIGGMTVVESGLDVMRDDPDMDLFKLDCTLPGAAEADAATDALADLGGIEVARLSPTEMEISRRGVSKGSAVSWLCEHLGIDEGRAVAFGDSGNDASMAGRELTFVAMGNAKPEIKDIADEICDTVQHDGVAKWLEEHL